MRMLATLLLGLALAFEPAGAWAQSGHAYRYDAMGRLVWQQDPDGKVTSYIYDPAGNRTGVTTFPGNPNFAPVAVDDAVIWNEGSGPLMIAVLGNDVDPGGALTIGGVAPPTFGTAMISGTSVLYTPPPNANQLVVRDTFSYVALDAGGMTDSAVVTVDLTNLPPGAVADAFTVPRNVPSVLLPLGNDSDPGGDTLTIRSVTTPSHGIATNLGTSIRYLPTRDYKGPDSLSYTIQDGEGGQATAPITIAVSSANQPPVAVPDTGGVTWNQTVEVEVLLNDSDPDGDTLTVISTTQGAHGSTGPTLDFKRVAYSAGSGFIGQDSFTYTVRDSQGATATTSVQISVDSGN